MKILDFSHHTFLKQEPVCNPGCVICQKILHRLDSTPILLRNELTGDLKTVPTYASREYLSKWSLWHEVPSNEAKKILSPDKFNNAVANVLMNSFLVCVLLFTKILFINKSYKTKIFYSLK